MPKRAVPLRFGYRHNWPRAALRVEREPLFQLGDPERPRERETFGETSGRLCVVTGCQEKEAALRRSLAAASEATVQTQALEVVPAQHRASGLRGDTNVLPRVVSRADEDGPSSPPPSTPPSGFQLVGEEREDFGITGDNASVR